MIFAKLFLDTIFNRSSITAMTPIWWALVGLCIVAVFALGCCRAAADARND